MCIREEIHHRACGHNDIVIRNCRNRLCRSAHQDLPVQIDTVEEIVQESRCRECRINQMVNSRPESSTLQVLIRAAEREDCYWELNSATAEEVNEPDPEHEAWYSPRVRGWVQELRGLGFLTVRETYSDGFVERLRHHNIYDPIEFEGDEEAEYLANMEGFGDFIYSPSAEVTEYDPAIALPRVEEFISSLPTIDPASIPEEDRSCIICLEPYMHIPLGGEPARINEQVARLPCAGGYIVGKDCLRQTFMPSKNYLLRCPMCRERLFSVETTEEGTEDDPEEDTNAWAGQGGIEEEPAEDTEEDTQGTNETDIDGWGDLPYAFLN